MRPVTPSDSRNVAMFCACAPELTNCRQALSSGAASARGRDVEAGETVDRPLERTGPGGRRQRRRAPSRASVRSALRSTAACRRMSPAGGVTVAAASILTMAARIRRPLAVASRSKSGARGASTSSAQRAEQGVRDLRQRGIPRQLDGSRARRRRQAAARDCVRDPASAASRRSSAGVGASSTSGRRARRTDRMRALSSQATGS